MELGTKAVSMPPEHGCHWHRTGDARHPAHKPHTCAVKPSAPLRVQAAFQKLQELMAVEWVPAMAANLGVSSGTCVMEPLLLQRMQVSG